MSIRCILYLIGIINCVILINGYPSDDKNEKCFNYCSNGGVCLMDDGKPQCYCLPEWKGERCDSVREYIWYDFETYKPIARSSLRNHPCAFVPPDMCLNGGFCAAFNFSLSCICPYTYVGKRCEQLSPCNNYCRNGGICTIEDDEPVCNCTGTSFDGVICSKYVTVDPQSTTADPRCAQFESFCYPGKCVITNGAFRGCQCPPTHTGRFCETVVGASNNPTAGRKVAAPPSMASIMTKQILGITCRDNPCRNSRPCYNSGNSYYCYCGPQFIGTNCEIDIG